MFRTCRFRLRPGCAEYARLAEVLEQQRQLYNAALQERRDAWPLARTSITKLDQYKSLTAIRADAPDSYGAVSVAMSRWTLERVDEAMKGFFARAKRGQAPGFPRFRPKSRFSTIGFTEPKGFKQEQGRLAIKGVNDTIRLKAHRPLPAAPEIRSATLTYDGHHWWLSVVAKLPVRARHRRAKAAVGIDLGIEHLMTLSTGEHIANPRWGDTEAAELRRHQRQLARCRRGSKRRVKVRARLARLQAQVRNRRRTHLHRVTKSIATRFGVIAIEKLKTRSLTRSAAGSVEEPGSNVKAKAGLNRALIDVSPATVINFLRQKAESAAGQVVKVDPRHTSQDCSGCGSRVPKPLSQRIHRCGCGLVLQRDVNAARNILARAVVRPADTNVGHQPERCPGERLAA